MFQSIHIEQEYKNAKSLLTTDPASQALYMSMAAVAARAIIPSEFDGLQAPLWSQVAQAPQLREGTDLCKYGSRREQPAHVALEVAMKVVRQNGLFVTPSLRGVLALTVIGMLTQSKLILFQTYSRFRLTIWQLFETLLTFREAPKRHRRLILRLRPVTYALLLRVITRMGRNLD
jgi:hypothetical protein